MSFEEVIISYLTGKNLERIGLHVYAETPVKPPPVFLLVRRSGGSLQDGIRHGSIYVETHAYRGKVSKLEALKAHEAAVEAMLEAKYHTPLFQCSLNADYDASDPEKDTYVYQSLFLCTM